MADFYQWGTKEQLTLFCHLQPRASNNEFAGQHGERLKVRITAPPVDGKANTQLIKFIAQQFGAAKTRVSISCGESGRHKIVQIKQPGVLPKSLGIAPNTTPGQ